MQHNPHSALPIADSPPPPRPLPLAGVQDVILFHPPSMDDNSSAPASSDEEAAGSDGGPPPEALPGFQFGGQKLRADGYTPLPVQT